MAPDILQIRNPELSILEQQTYITNNLIGIATEKNRCSSIATDMTLDQITQKLRLDQIISNPDQYLKKDNLTIDPNISNRKKADIVTTVAAAQLLDGKKISGELSDKNIVTAASLMLTNIPHNAIIQNIRDKSIREDHDIGLQTDIHMLQKNIGDAATEQILAGKIDRLTATAISKYSEKNGLSPTQAVSVLRSMTLGTDSSLEINMHIPQIKTFIEINRRLNTLIPKSGLKPNDLSYSEISNQAYQVYEQTKSLISPQKRIEILKNLTEKENIPSKISHLKEILSVIDVNPEIKAISFDLYDTLVQWTEDYADRYQRYPERILKHFKNAGIVFDKNQLQQINSSVWSDRWQYYQSKGVEIELNTTIDELINKATIGQTIIPEKRKALNALLTKEWYALELENAVAMPGAKETLEALKQKGIKICLTSNASWSQKHVHRVLNRFGLLEYFDTINISSEIGKMKNPNFPDFFHYSWNKLGIPYNQILHIGDNPKDDVLGAKNAGGKSIQYDNPLAYNRLEIDKTHGTLRLLRHENTNLYAQTVVEMQRHSLEESSYEWITAHLEKHHIPPIEKKRVMRLAQETYRRTRDIFAPLYINLSESILQELNTHKTDMVLCCARDGLASAVMTKIMLNLDKDRYPNVRSDQIHYIHTSRKLLDRVTNPQNQDDEKFKKIYYGYLQQKDAFMGKNILISDNVTSGNTYRLLTNILKELNAASTKGLYLDKWNNTNPEIHSFLQESLESSQYVLGDISLVQMEALLHGPHNSVENIQARPTTSGLSFEPKPTKKSLPPEVLSRGLSQESILFMNDVAIRGLIDAARIRHRSRLAGTPDPTNKTVVNTFIQYLHNLPIDDLLKSIPLYDMGRWYLPSEHPFISNPQLKKNNL